MKLIMLGSGTSTGVPRIGEDWGECDPADPRNRRSRVSIIIESAEGKRLLVDTSPDLRHQLLANGMGLSFAYNLDPLHGAQTPVLGQFYTLLVTMTFLALNGHLRLIEILVDGFRTLPVGATGLGQDGLWTVVTWGSTLFSGALSVALPGVTALITRS